jgi:type VI secretion system protein ImpG
MDEILRYYEAEMRYLREAGKEFAQAHPDRARALNIDRVGDLDPYVERLYEGFAFLTARIQQRLDDELPEFTEGLVGMLWPHYLRMIPSLAIVELLPETRESKETTIVAAGMSVRSGAIGATGVQALYRTTQAVTLQPVRLVLAEPVVGVDGRSSVRLAFEIEPTAERGELDLSHMRLFINADQPGSFALYLALTKQVASVAWRVPGLNDGAATGLPGVRLEPAGFSTGERLWPKAEETFAGYQLLLEYFTFREKFLFVDLNGFDVGALAADAGSFELEIHLDRTYPMDLRFSAQNVRLNCTPVINLFELGAEPVHIDHHQTEYRVTPVHHHAQFVQTYSVDAVESVDPGNAERFEYVPFASFRHRGGMLRHEAPERFFHTRVRQGVSGLYDTTLILGGHAWETMDDLPEETLSLRVTGTHGMLPRKGLREASLDQLVGSVPGVAGVRQLTAPTMPVYPPLNDRFQWRVLSHLVPNFLSLLDVDALRGTLALYDWTDDELNRRRLDGIREVSLAEINEFRNGGLDRGVSIQITLDSHAFAGEGDMTLFGELLHRFFALYAEINLFTRLTVISLPSGKRAGWPRSYAVRPPL